MARAECAYRYNPQLGGRLASPTDNMMLATESTGYWQDNFNPNLQSQIPQVWDTTYPIQQAGYGAWRPENGVQYQNHLGYTTQPNVVQSTSSFCTPDDPPVLARPEYNRSESDGSRLGGSARQSISSASTGYGLLTPSCSSKASSDDSPPRPVLLSSQRQSELVIKQEYPQGSKRSTADQGGDDDDAANRWSKRLPRADRIPHSIVERRYREHLNKQIQALREALPEAALATSDKYEDEDPEYKPRPSKASIIAAAVDYIRDVQSEIEELRASRKALEDRQKDDNNDAPMEF